MSSEITGSKARGVLGEAAGRHDRLADHLAGDRVDDHGVKTICGFNDLENAEEAMAVENPKLCNRLYPG